jgi:hypothetical protein
MKVESNNIHEFLRWSYIISYLNIQDDCYYIDEEILVVNREEKFSSIELKVIKDFCERKKYHYEVENNTKITIHLKPLK